MHLWLQAILDRVAGFCCNVDSVQWICRASLAIVQKPDSQMPTSEGEGKGKGKELDESSWCAISSSVHAALSLPNAPGFFFLPHIWMHYGHEQRRKTSSN